MRYMTDAQVANVARFLREHGIDCETVHMRMRGNENSQVSISDPEIVQYLMAERSRGSEIVLICNDIDLAGHCKVQGLPVMFVPEMILERVRRAEQAQ
jgi:predicted nuclease of predicted toxin-antitoxin system